jgi:hypothetical protein
MTSSQDLFFEIWSILLDQLKIKTRPERLEKLLDFSCFEKDFLKVSLNKIDDLIKEGVDINIPFYILPPRGNRYSLDNALKKTISIYYFGYINREYVYGNKYSKDYLEELIYYLIERCRPDKNIILFIMNHKKLYKILEELLKRFDEKIDLSNYNINTEYLEILLGFSCLELDKKITFSYRRPKALPIESLLIEYILNYSTNNSNDNLEENLSSFDKERMHQIINNISLLKKYSPEPSYDDVLKIVKGDLSLRINYKDINNINNVVSDVFYYFMFKIT